MPEPRFVLENENGELSPTNKAFEPTLHGSVETPFVGIYNGTADVAELTARVTEAGYHIPGAMLPGVPGIEWSLDGILYSGDGVASIAFDAPHTGVAIWARCVSAQSSLVTVDVTDLQGDIVIDDVLEVEAPSGVDAGVTAETGTTPTAGGVTPIGTDVGGANDIGTTPATSGTTPSGMDAGLANETGTVPTGVGSAPAGADTGLGSESGSTPNTGGATPTGGDAGLGSETGTIPTGAGTVQNGSDSGLATDTGQTPSGTAQVPSGTDAGDAVESGSTPLISLGIPTLTNLVAMDGAVSMTIGAVPGAESYEIQRTFASDPTFTVSGWVELISGLAADVVVISGLANAYAYIFRVRAVADTQVSTWSAKSEQRIPQPGTYSPPTGTDAGLGSNVGNIPEARWVIPSGVDAGKAVNATLVTPYTGTLSTESRYYLIPPVGGGNLEGTMLSTTPVTQRVGYLLDNYNDFGSKFSLFALKLGDGAFSSPMVGGGSSDPYVLGTITVQQTAIGGEQSITLRGHESQTNGEMDCLMHLPVTLIAGQVVTLTLRVFIREDYVDANETWIEFPSEICGTQYAAILVV